MNRNDGGFHSLLEEGIARVLTGHGAHVTPAPSEPVADLVAQIPTSDGPRHLTVDVGTGRGPRRGDIAGHDYVSPTLAAKYRAHQRFYVDALGNAYIALPGFHIDVQGRKPQSNDRSRQLRPRTAFGAAGARLVFALLAQPDLVGSTVRELAELSGVSTGSVNNAMRDLEVNGFLGTASGTRRLRRTENLADLWLATYWTRLSPKLEETSLAGPDPQWWATTPTPGDSVLGGGVALTAMGFDIIPSISLVYGAPPWGDVRKAGRLRRDGNLNVTLRQQFWSPQLNPSSQLAPALLIYADAMGSDDPRQADAAHNLWENSEDLQRLRART